ncbi:MAG: hypothetical protein LUH05_08090 [Candidatus Gastranaerophilales bacterium]|nr:hypothetical protein [Candidatus Gastranaerophilales bacterium]
MKVNAINTYNYNNAASFKHTAVPYPEYAGAYTSKQDSEKSAITSFISKISSLFSPKVNEEAQQIKSEIDNIYVNTAVDADESKPHEKLLSVLA